MSKARVRRGKVFRMRALAVQKPEELELRGRGLAEAIRRLQEELRWVAGSDYKLVVDMAACMKQEDVGFYARQGWAGVDRVWEWDSGTSVCPGSQAASPKEAAGS